MRYSLLLCVVFVRLQADTFAQLANFGPVCRDIDALFRVESFFLDGSVPFFICFQMSKQSVLRGGMALENHADMV